MIFVTFHNENELPVYSNARLKIHPIKTDENLPNFSKVAIILVTEGVMIFLKKGKKQVCVHGRMCAYSSKEKLCVL